MRRILFLLSCVVVAVAFTAKRCPSASAQERDDPRAKLRAIQEQKAALQKQLDALAKQEQALRKGLEEKAKEKEGYIKVEVKGRLCIEMDQDVSGRAKREQWSITVHGVSWELDLRKKKELLETAKLCEGKSVLIAGTLMTREPTIVGSYISFWPEYVFVVATLKPAQD